MVLVVGALVVDLLVAVLAAARPGAREVPADFALLRGVNVYTLEDERAAPADEQVGEPASSYRFLAAHGVRLVRLAVPWQRLQPPPTHGPVTGGLGAALDPRYLVLVRAQLAAIEAAGMFPVLDLHNGCAYPEGPGAHPADEVSCGHGLPTAAAVGIWTRLSAAVGADDRIAAYDLFNEPVPGEVDPTAYRDVVQAVVDALRARGDTHPVWVETMKSQPMTTLAPGGPWVHDPAHRVTYSGHFYPPYHDLPGYRYPGDDRTTGLLTELAGFAAWCRAGRTPCSIGELGWPGDDTGRPPPAADLAAWDALGERAYRIADAAGMDVTYFGASSGSVSALWAYAAASPATPVGRRPAAPGVTRAYRQAAVVERHPSSAPRR